MTRPPLGFVLLLAGILLPACAATTTGPKADDSTAPTTGDAPESVAPTTAPPSAPVWSVTSEPDGTGEPVSVDDLQPFVTDERTWFVLKGKSAGSTVERSRKPTSAHHATWEADQGDGDIHFLVRTDDGGVALAAVEANRDKALSLFDPPLGVSPAELHPGETFERKARMKVTDLDDEQKIQQRGTATRRLEHLGSVQVSTSAGSRIVQVLRMEFRADLDLAKATTETFLYVVPGEGVIALKSREVVKAALIFNRTVDWEIVRLGDR